MNIVEAQSKKELKEEKKATEYKAAKALIESGGYNFEASSCTTQKGRRIDLTTNSGSLVINKDNAIADLPYFGVVQVANMSGDAGITFDNENTEYEIKYDDKKYKITIKFSAKNKSETFEVSMTVFGNGNGSVNISSSQRNFISYRGKISPVKNPE